MTTIPLVNSDIVVLVSDADADIACFRWRLKSSDHKDYAVTSVTRDNRHYTLRMHRLVAARMGLRVRKGIDVHHKNGDRFDNQRHNLEACGHVAHVYRQRY